MIKDERYKKIMKLLTSSGTVSVNEIMEELKVSDMTVRRDLNNLEKEGLLKRVHGGAKVITFNEELSHKEKKIINLNEKKSIAKKAAELISEGDTIFLGPGTTIELLANLIQKNDIKIVTNCLPIFEILSKKNDQRKVYLVGGEIRASTESFFGEITNSVLSNMKFKKAFFSCNAVNNNEIMTSTLEEGVTQSIALNNSQERYLLADSSKIGKNDFCVYYNLEDITKLIINDDGNSKSIESENVLLV